MAVTDPFLALVDALDLDVPQGDQGWSQGEPSKQNIQPGAKGIWKSRLCRQLVDELGVDPEGLERKGRVIRDLGIELGWDRDKFDGFDQPLLDRVAGFIRPLTKPLPSSTGVSHGASSSRRNLLLRTSISAHKPIRNALTCVV